MPARLWALPPLQVFTLMNLIIERLGAEMQPYVSGLLQLLPRIWAMAEGQSLLRIQVGCAWLRRPGSMVPTAG
jgi:hypothetical protein